MRFTKCHGLGNDYLLIDAFADPLPSNPDWSALSIAMSDRRRGVGADGVIVVEPPSSPASDARMRIFNSDGSEAEMCGNGIRCVAKLLADRGHVAPDRHGDLRIETPAGLRICELNTGPHGLVESVIVDMGPPEFDPARLPINPDHFDQPPDDSGLALVAGRECQIVAVGNPHMVCFIEEPVDDIALEREGPRLEHHPAFPERMNIHFVNALDRTQARMRTWERGAGATAACGTGACAVLASGVRRGILDRSAVLHLPGGALNMRWDESTNHIFKQGPAVTVFSGEWTIPHHD